MSGDFSIVAEEIIFDFDNINLGESVSLELLIKDNREERESSEYIKSWANVSRRVGKEYYLKKNSDDMTSLKVLKLEIVSARTIEPNKHKKYVAYTVMLRVVGGEGDTHPAVLERRYNDFLYLYNQLKKEFSVQMASIQFPRKAFVGNFSPEVIRERCLGFETFLDFIVNTSQIRCSGAVTSFFQERELDNALKLIHDKQYYQAMPLIQNCFWVMNKLQTGRAPVVLRNLCLWLCVASESGDTNAVDIASLAVRRFQGVSDSELLRYYVPLLCTSVELGRRSGIDVDPITEHLDSMIKRGIARQSAISLLQLLLDDFSNSEPHY